jgi:uncharacterized membrane protein
MIRKITAVSLLVSFIAMSTSGITMLVISRPSFTMQMHPVHILFGIILIISVLSHLTFNYKSLLSYLKSKTPLLVLSILTVLLVVAYGISLNKKIPENLALQMDKAASEAEK